MPKNFPCPLCPTVLTRSTVLRDHLRAHAGEKPFICAHPGCGRSFTRRPDLLQHQQLHSGAREFTCKQTDEHGTNFGCGAKFHRRRDLERHRKRARGSRCLPSRTSMADEEEADLSLTRAASRTTRNRKISASTLTTLQLATSKIKQDCCDCGLTEELVSQQARENSILPSIAMCCLFPLPRSSQQYFEDHHLVHYVWHCRLSHTGFRSLSLIQQMLSLLARPGSQTDTHLTSERWKRLYAHLMPGEPPKRVSTKYNLSAVINMAMFENAVGTACSFDLLGRVVHRHLADQKSEIVDTTTIGFPGTSQLDGRNEQLHHIPWVSVPHDTALERLTQFSRGFLSSMIAMEEYALSVAA